MQVIDDPRGATKMSNLGPLWSKDKKVGGGVRGEGGGRAAMGAACGDRGLRGWQGLVGVLVHEQGLRSQGKEDLIGGGEAGRGQGRRGYEHIWAAVEQGQEGGVVRGGQCWSVVGGGGGPASPTPPPPNPHHPTHNP